jgi:undecaprenyl-diphosphatase
MSLPDRRKLVELDYSLSQKLQVARRTGKLRAAAALFAHSGDSWFWLAGLGLVWLLAPEPWRELAAIMAGALVVTAVLVLGIKFTVRRQRPEGEWGSIYRKTDPHSFPSGHAARASLLAVLALGLGPLWSGVLLFIWAPLVSLARVAMGVHYLSDVFAGALLGAGVGIVILMLL